MIPVNPSKWADGYRGDESVASLRSALGVGRVWAPARGGARSLVMDSLYNRLRRAGDRSGDGPHREDEPLDVGGGLADAGFAVVVDFGQQVQGPAVAGGPQAVARAEELLE